MTASGNAIASARTFAADVINGFLEITHNGFALLGLAVAFVAITLTVRPDLRQTGEEQLRGWLHERRGAERHGGPLRRRLRHDDGDLRQRVPLRLVHPLSLARREGGEVRRWARSFPT